MAYGLRSPVMTVINWEGDTRTFLVNAADKLHAGGHLITLLESAREGVGPDVQAEFDHIIAIRFQYPLDLLKKSINGNVLVSRKNIESLKFNSTLC